MNVAIAESSSIVFEGLSGIFHKSGLNFNISKAVSLEEIEQICARRKIEFIIINPSLIQNNLKSFNNLRSHFEKVKWIGLVYAYYDQNLLSMFDCVINISDTSETIASTITRLMNSDVPRDQNAMQDVLSERENDVLKLLATGMANKEIADKLNISTNTVITHRKNITQKTGIKSVSGLTIYAVVQKLISLDTLTE